MLPPLTSYCTHAHTCARSCPGLTSLVSLSWTVQASVELVDHTSTHQPFIVPSTVVMERVNVAQRGRKWWPRPVGPAKAPAWLASLCSRTHLHMYITAHSVGFSASLDLKRASRTVAKTHNAPASLQIVGNPGHVQHI